MINNICIDYKFLKPRVKRSVFFAFLFVATTVSAQSDETLPEQKIETDANAEAVKSDVIVGENTEEVEAYNIYKKQHPVNPCERGMDTYDYEKSWYDESQIYINSRFCEPALWFDNFFATDRIFEEGAAGTYVRWRNEFTYDEEEHFKFKTSISASVELPGLKDKLRITFASDEDEDLRDIAPGNGEGTSNSLGLQLDVLENIRSKFNVRLSASPKILFRYRYTYPAFDNLILRLTQEVQRKRKTHSARTLFDIEYAFKQNFLFRASTEGKFSEEYEGIDWLQALVLYHRLDKKTSLSYETSVNGISEPQTLATSYRVGVRFRKNFHRKWLFYEIAPEMTWPITLDDQRVNILKERRSRWLLFFRLEVHFGNAYKKRYQDHN